MLKWREDFGLYKSSHLGQKSLTDCTCGRSDIPIGSTGCASQITRGHLPKSAFLNFSSCSAGVSMLSLSGMKGMESTNHLCQTPSGGDVSCMN